MQATALSPFLVSTSFNPYSNPLRQILLGSSFTDKETEPGKGKLPKVRLQLLKGRAGIGIQVI